MLRISIRKEQNKTIIQIDGVLRSEGVAQLEKVVSKEKRPLVLDLSNVHHLDPSGAVAIVTLTKVGVELIGASHYIELLLIEFGLTQ